MEGTPSTQAAAVLAALADLAPTSEQHPSGLTIPTEWFRWLPVDAVRLFASEPWTQTEAAVVSVDREFGKSLAAVDQIRAEQRSLRVGWLFVTGHSKTEDGKSRRVFHPLVTVPVRVQITAFGAGLRPAGDAEVTTLVGDHRARHQLEQHIELGGGALDGLSGTEVAEGYLARLERLKRFARGVAAAAGFHATRIVPAFDGPEGFMRHEGLVIVAGVGVYAIHERSQSSRASSLRALSLADLTRWTAFHSVYLDEQPPDLSRVRADDAVSSPYVLTPVQSHAVASSRSEPVTLISGAPGTGKSHTVAAIACDALARGETVLVAAKTDATVDALVDLLERGPGPDPVVFGSNERRDALATRLSSGQLEPADDDAVTGARRLAEQAALHRNRARKAIADALGAERLLAGAADDLTGRATVPGLFGPEADLAGAERLLATATSTATGWWTRRRRRRATAQLMALAQCPPDTDVEDVRSALAVARATRAAHELQARGGLTLSAAWTQLMAADDEARRALGQWLERESSSRQHLNHATLGSVAALATALRSGRGARRAQLERLDDARLTRALPLWVGTLADVDDLLPPVPALFDLVIIDEASSVDQSLAATTLLRGRRAVIAGDPRQLRQVSFVSDDDLRAAIHGNGLDNAPVLGARLDVRRNSAFDLAAGACPVLVLNEHFRCNPHLVEFVARRLYDGKVQIATRSPRTESIDCVDVIRTDGRRDKDGVVAAEVEVVIEQLEKLLHAGVRSTGVVTPFRAQADALEAAVLKAFSAEDLEALDLRVGTVHVFQGNERDVIIASFGLGPDEGPTSWRFVEDPHLFAVFMTRARRKMTIVVSADPPEGGLVAAYLAQADAPPGPPKPAGPLLPWASAIADGLRSADVPIISAYPTGRHVVDICLADERRSVAIECGVHPEGPDAHIDRHLALARFGWEFLEAYQSRWGDRQAELLVNLVAAVRTATSTVER